MRVLTFKILFCCLLTLVRFNGFGQQVIDSYTHNALNNYAEFANDNIHALWGFHLQFRKFNTEIIKLHLLPPENRVGKTINYHHQNFLKQSESFNILPEEFYLQILKESEFVPSEYRYILNAQAGTMDRILARIVALSIEMENYTDSGKNNVDSDLKLAYKLLDQGESLFEEFYTVKEELQFTLESASFHFQHLDPEDPHLRHQEQLKSLIEPSRQILEQVRRSNRKVIPPLQDELLAAANYLKKEEAVSLNRVRIYGEDVGPDPYIRYDFVLTLVKNISDYANSYLEADYSSNTFDPHGPGYYFYNKRLTYGFNRYGRGLVLQYNKFVDSSDVPLIKMIEEPHWFKVHNLDIDRREKPPEEVIPIVFEADSISDLSPLEGYASNNLVFLLDVSSSMNKPEKIELLKSSMKHLIQLMRPEDQISIVKYSGTAEIVLVPTSSLEKEKIFQAIHNLEPGGKSNIKIGLRMAYDVLDEAYINDGNNKIILASDGAFEIDKKSLKFISSQAINDRLLSIFFFGKQEEQDQKQRLETMSNSGKGNYFHIKPDNVNQIMLEEARRISME